MSARKREEEEEEESQQQTALLPDWSQLSPDILSKIAGTLDDASDRVRFAAVCKPWASAVSESAPVLPRIRSPWVLLPAATPIEAWAHRHTFFNVARDKFYTLDFPSDARGTMLTCSSRGWIFAADTFQARTDPVSPLLVNPVTRSQVSLPPLPLPPPEQTRMVTRCEVVAVWPQTLVIVMVALYNGPIFCFQHQTANGGNTGEWIPICDGNGMLEGGVRDLTYNSRVFTYFRGRHFVLDANSSTSVIDPHMRQAVQVIPPLLGSEHCFRSGNREMVRQRYLVPSSLGEELFLVIAPSRATTEKFEVFKLVDAVESETKWSKVRSIGNHVLFVDSNHAMALPAGDHSIFKRNCIVFLNSSVAYGPEDVPSSHEHVTRFSFFDVGSHRVEQLLCMNVMDQGYTKWFCPSLS